MLCGITEHLLAVRLTHRGRGSEASSYAGAASAATSALFDFYVGLHGHSWPEEVLGVLTLFEHDLDRDALDDLDVISRGVLRREQAEARPAGAGDVENVPV